MTLLEQLRNAGISDIDIISTFQFKANSYSKNGERSYAFGDLRDPGSFWGEIYFNKKGELCRIVPGTLLENSESKSNFIKDALSAINGEHGYTVHQRILFSQKPLKGKFQWGNTFRIRPCLITSNIGKGLAWGIDSFTSIMPDTKEYLGPPYPFILEVRTQKSPNFIVETHRFLEELDSYQWLLRLLIPHLSSSPISRNSSPKWIMLQKKGIPEYHLAYEAFNADKSEIEKGENFSDSDIPDALMYSGSVDYWNHLWFQSSEIELPPEINSYLDYFENLDETLKENFRRSLYWFSTGLELLNHEQLSVIPFTIAIECLTSSPSNVNCPTCNRPSSNGPTKLFKEFLDNHLQLPENIDHLKKSIYDKRSSVVHGSFAFAADQGFFSIGKYEDSEKVTENFVRRALLDWLKKNGTIKTVHSTVNIPTSSPIPHPPVSPSDSPPQ